jgi:hypothetical protein
VVIAAETIATVRSDALVLFPDFSMVFPLSVHETNDAVDGTFRGKMKAQKDGCS